MSTPQSGDLDPERLARVRKRIARLCERGLEEAWVAEVAGALLLGLTSVRRVMQEQDLGAPEALIEVIRHEVAAIREFAQPQAVILTVVLALEAEYVGLSAPDRHRIAAETFRGSRGRPVSPATMRKYHLPKAQFRLARRLLRRELEVQDQTT